MPIPFILGAIAVAAGIGGVGAGIKGAMDMSDAKDTLKKAQKRDEENQKRHKTIDEKTCKSMDDLGRLEMSILSSFKAFADVVEKIKNRPTFADIKLGNVCIPKFDAKELEKASIGAGILVGGLSGAALGTAGGFAASGATTAAVMALGTASTGTAISSLSGVAATNATLAALGGGSLAAGGGGMALGTTLLGGATLGIGILVGGVIFSLVGSNVSEKADKAYSQMLENERLINKICSYLESLDIAATNYILDLTRANEVYKEQFKLMESIVILNRDYNGMVDWSKLRDNEKTAINNVVMLVGLLYHMCKVKLVNKNTFGDKINTINTTDINDARNKCNETLKTIVKDYHNPQYVNAKVTHATNDIEAGVKSVIAIICNLNPEHILGCHYIKNLGCHVGTVSAQLENAFDIKIPGSDVRDMETVNDAIRIVTKLVNINSNNINKQNSYSKSPITTLQIEPRVKSIIARITHENPTQILRSHYLKNLGAHVGTVAAQLENAFEIKFSGSDVRDMETVNDAIRIVTRLLNSKS